MDKEHCSQERKYVFWFMGVNCPFKLACRSTNWKFGEKSISSSIWYASMSSSLPLQLKRSSASDCQSYMAQLISHVRHIESNSASLAVSYFINLCFHGKIAILSILCSPELLILLHCIFCVFTSCSYCFVTVYIFACSYRTVRTASVHTLYLLFMIYNSYYHCTNACYSSLVRC